ncbi:VCBS repeat-containing protein [Lacihabitans soyangensis]|uniref:RNA-binding protein n=1 Tax=Lacihabitans soyangensis TaxID=869394 RepID=A0AAE3H1F7_9BACT|nr:VCBS repeat-containing protein [Lacihabitans soyangensis]MCP9763023.1 RNA-binding protein [Lacihabitans soyangensis]
MTLRFLFLSIISITFLSCKDNTLFTKIEASDSGIQFSNRIIENDSINILDFEYVYNGSGVGIADFNKDGLQDVFFSGNQVANKLYLNKGDFKFDDISSKAGIEASNRWCAGVVPVDINSDGWMDVYVAATVKEPASERHNLLFVSQGLKDGVPVFKEMAAEYGVNDSGHSENAAFFDYDNDGDLDLYVLTNEIDQYPNTFRPKVKDGTYPNTDRLYRCDFDEKLGHSYYTNVSKEAGITIEGYGLGLNICDINKDGWKDIYVTNDYAADDLLYINNGNGTFTDQANQYFKHTSSSAMGNDVADINNDGLLDVFAVDMLAKNNLRKKVLAPPNNYQLFKLSDEFGYTYQYMRNTLQLNNGKLPNNKQAMFSEVSLLSGIAETDWSWTPSLADFDNDGFRDIIITNGFPKDVTDRDFMAFRAEAENLAEKTFLLGQIPEVKISNYAYRNKGNLEFEDVTEKWGMDIPSFSNGAVYADLDNDGDLDYVVNNINDSAFVFKNNQVQLDKAKENHFLRIKTIGDKSNLNGLGTVALLEFENGEKMIHENNPYRGYLSSVEPFIHFGLGAKKVKKLTVQWYNGMSQIIVNPKLDQVLEVNIKNANVKTDYIENMGESVFEDITENSKLDFIHKEIDFIDFNVQNLLPFKLSELGPGMSVGDVNGDKLEDFFLGGGRGYSGMFFLQKADGTFTKKTLLAQYELQNKFEEDLGSLLFDADGDKDLDLYLCRGGSEGRPGDKVFEDKLYLNDGKGNFSEKMNAIPAFATSTSCVRASDYDNDGDLDLFVAGRNVPGEYPKFTDSYLFRNDSRDGQAKFTNVVLPELKNLGLICDVLWTDFDNDGWMDLLVAGEWSAPRLFKNNKGKLSEMKDTGLEKLKGLWTSTNAGDFDNDGDMDYLLGNIGLNAQFKGNEKEPARVLAKDFDNNGNYDIIPFVYYINEEKEKFLVPFNGKDDVNKQLNVTRSRFVSYKDFAKANIDNLLTKEEKKDAQDLELNFMKSVIILNQGGGKFLVKDLPMEVQFSPANGIVVEDFDSDGFQDIVVSGNNFGIETSVGRYDASNGVYLKGNGTGNFSIVKNSGFYVPSDAKALVSIANSQGEICLLASQNRGPLKMFKTPLMKQEAELNPNSRFYSYVLNGKTTKKEIYHGSGYLGQSARYVVLPKGAKGFKIN